MIISIFYYSNETENERENQMKIDVIKRNI